MIILRDASDATRIDYSNFEEKTGAQLALLAAHARGSRFFSSPWATGPSLTTTTVTANGACR
jgi:hypothetical protein